MKTIGTAFLLVVVMITGAVLAAVWDKIPAAVAAVGDLFMLASKGCGVTLLIVVGVALWWWMARQSHEHRRMRDGAWAVEYYWLVPWTVRLLNALRGIPSPRGRLDPNLAINPVHVIADAVYAPDPAAGWERQAKYAELQEGANKLRAIAPGDATMSLPWSNIGRGGVQNAATAKLMAGAYDPKQKAKIETVPENHQLPAPPARTWTPIDALNLNTRTKWTMGATPTGELVKWDVGQVSHVRLHGITQGSGKTNLANTIAAGAARTGAEIVVMDRRRFKDWQAFAGCARLIDTRDPKQFAAALHGLVAIYQERDAILGHRGAANISALEDPPRRVVAIIAEFGAACATAAAEGMLDEVLYPLQLLAREAGATGVHLVVEDQAVDRRWPRGVSTNLEPVTGRLPENYGAAGGYVFAHKLPAYTFHYLDTNFATWPMAPVLATLLANVRPVTVDGVATVSESVPQSVSDGVFLGVSPEVDLPLPDAGNTGNNGDNGKWFEFILAYMATPDGRGLWRTPAEGVRDLARIMSRHETGGEAAEDGYVGIASRTAAQIRKDARTEKGKKIGTDIANEVQP